MKTKVEWAEIHKKNTEWVNQQIKICLLARKLLKGKKQEDYFHLIFHMPEYITLKTMIHPDRDYWYLRMDSYSLGIIGEIFDIKHFIYEARRLKHIGVKYDSLLCK